MTVPIETPREFRYPKTKCGRTTNAFSVITWLASSARSSQRVRRRSEFTEHADHPRTTTLKMRLERTEVSPLPKEMIDGR